MLISIHSVKQQKGVLYKLDGIKHTNSILMTFSFQNKIQKSLLPYLHGHSERIISSNK